MVNIKISATKQKSIWSLSKLFLIRMSIPIINHPLGTKERNHIIRYLKMRSFQVSQDLCMQEICTLRKIKSHLVYRKKWWQSMLACLPADIIQLKLRVWLGRSKNQVILCHITLAGKTDVHQTNSGSKIRVSLCFFWVFCIWLIRSVLINEAQHKFREDIESSCPGLKIPRIFSKFFRISNIFSKFPSAGRLHLSGFVRHYH